MKFISNVGNAFNLQVWDANQTKQKLGKDFHRSQLQFVLRNCMNLNWVFRKFKLVVNAFFCFDEPLFCIRLWLPWIRLFWQGKSQWNSTMGFSIKNAENPGHMEASENVQHEFRDETLLLCEFWSGSSEGLRETSVIVSSTSASDLGDFWLYSFCILSADACCIEKSDLKFKDNQTISNTVLEPRTFPSLCEFSRHKVRYSSSSSSSLLTFGSWLVEHACMKWKTEIGKGGSN